MNDLVLLGQRMAVIAVAMAFSVSICRRVATAIGRSSQPWEKLRFL